jgi:class 3 adenylate cyclase
MDETAGQGTIVLLIAFFASAVQALHCTIAIQEQLRFKPDGLRLRIGVHQGEVAVSLARTSWRTLRPRH